MDDAAKRRERLESLLAGYFDLKTAVMVERAVAVATPEQLADDAELDLLFTDFVDVLEDRYDRADPGWRASFESFLRIEFDRQVEQARGFERQFDDLDG